MTSHISEIKIPNTLEIEGELSMGLTNLNTLVDADIWYLYKDVTYRVSVWLEELERALSGIICDHSMSIGTK